MGKFTEDFGEFLRDSRSAKAVRPRLDPAKVRRNWIGVGIVLFMVVGFTLIGILTFNVSGWFFLLVIPVVVISQFGARMMDWYDWKYNL